MPRRKHVGLTLSQVDFLRILQYVVERFGSPVSADQIRLVSRKSDSRVRSHLKILISSGYVACVATTRIKRYVPSALWIESIGPQDVVGYKGYCSHPGCQKIAVEYMRGRYWCRDHLIGVDLITDLKEMRDRWLESVGLTSNAAAILNEGISRGSQKRGARKTKRRKQKRHRCLDAGFEPIELSAMSM